MKTVHLPQLQRDVSLLGVGSDWFSPAGQHQAFEMLDAYRALGGNLVDTAQVYGGGNAERTIGAWVAARGNRADVVILDKGCHCPPYEINHEAVHESITGCLQRLGADYLDLWAFHRDKPDEPVGPLVEALNEEVAAGRIRAFGGSNWSAARIAEANHYAEQRGLMGMAFSSPNLALAIPIEPFWPGCTHATDEDIAWHASSGVPLISWSSQSRGFFLDSSGPHNRSDKELVRVYHNEENFEKLKRARELAKEKGVAPIQIALAYVLNLPVTVIALIGPHNPQELASSAAAADIELTRSEMNWLALRTQSR